MLTRFLPVTLLFGLTVSACHAGPEDTSAPLAAGNRIGDFKGYYAINTLLRQRVIAPAFAENFNLSEYLGDYDADSGQLDGLAGLLGGFAGQGASNGFRNGRPNAMNMLLWDMALSKLAEDASQACLSAPPAAFGPAMMLATGPHSSALKPLCAWPAATAKQGTVLEDLWYAVMGYEAPATELAAWRDGLLSPTSPVAAATGVEATRTMLKALFLNPTFLLED